MKGDKQDEHTLTMFYMERGMWESNMMIAFNFPDDNEFAVEKQVDKREVNPCLSIPLRMPLYSLYDPKSGDTLWSEGRRKRSNGKKSDI